MILAAVVSLTALLSYNLGVHSERARAAGKDAPPKLALKGEYHAGKRPQEKRIAKLAKAPKIAIVMDDFGYNVNELDEIFAMKEPITFSVLPNLQFSGTVARTAHQNGYEVILHLPLESERKDVREETGTIRASMGEEGALDVLEKDIASVPYLSGVSNHMGSRATADESLMETIMSRLKRRDLYFFDSIVTDKTVCAGAAAKAGIKFGKRDVFLDNSGDTEAIKKAMTDLRRIAFRRGWAVGICHYRPNTIRVLASAMPDLAAEGVKFVYLSELVK